MKRIKIRLTLKELLLFAGILVALAAIVLYWREMLPLEGSFVYPSYSEIVPDEMQRLVGNTFALFR